MTNGRTHDIRPLVPSLRRFSVLAICLAAILIAGCGSSSGGAVSLPKIAPARAFALSGFQPSRPVLPGRPTTI